MVDQLGSQKTVGQKAGIAFAIILLILASLACERVTPTPPPTVSPAPLMFATLAPIVPPTPTLTVTPMVVIVEQTVVVTAEVTRLFYIAVTVTSTSTPTLEATP